MKKKNVEFFFKGKNLLGVVSPFGPRIELLLLLYSLELYFQMMVRT